MQVFSAPFNAALRVTYAIRIIIQMLPILHGLHTKGFVHRDIKGANIMFNKERDCLSLIDFGTLAELGRIPERSGGTFFYQPPSVLRNPLAATKRSDDW